MFAKKPGSQNGYKKYLRSYIRANSKTASHFSKKQQQNEMEKQSQQQRIIKDLEKVAEKIEEEILSIDLDEHCSSDEESADRLDNELGEQEFIRQKFMQVPDRLARL